MELLPYLDDYEQYPKTKNCYLDGRYFNLVFKNYPGLINSPLHIHLKYTQNNQKIKLSNTSFILIPHHTNIIRIIIETNKTRHSGVLLIDTDLHCYYFDCNNYPEKRLIMDLIKNSLHLHTLHEIDTNIQPEINPNCNKSGFCVAYSIKFVYDHFNGNDFDFSNILKFAKRIEEEYPPLNNTYPDIEYGILGGVTGGLVGAGFGGLVGGVPGALVGGGLGGLAGYYLTEPRGYYDPDYYY